MNSGDPAVRRGAAAAVALVLVAGAILAAVVLTGSRGGRTAGNALPLPGLASSAPSQTSPVVPPPTTGRVSAVPAKGFLFGAAAGARRGVSRAQVLEGLEQKVGRKFELHRTYQLWDDPPVSDATSFDVATGRVPAISIKPKLRHGGAIPWTEIASGAQDATIKAQATALKALGKPVILSFHHEPENDADYGTPADFVAAWRHYVSVFRAEGAGNVSFAWILMSGSFSRDAAKANAFYPGDDAVDWIGVDTYNWYDCKNFKWKSLGEVLASFRTWAAPHRKPIFIAELGSAEDPAMPGRKGQWFRDALTTLKGWPQVKAVAYFQNRGIGCGWPVDTSPSSLAGFRALGADPYARPTPTQ